MISSFPIYRVEPQDRYGTNTGSDAEDRFYKYWCNRAELGHCLFKAAARVDEVSSRFAIDLLDFNRQQLLSRSAPLAEKLSIDVPEDLGR